ATQATAINAARHCGIRIVHKHEQCYGENPCLTTLKRVTDGISLIRHTFCFFDYIVSKDSNEQLRTELKLLLRELSWVQIAIKLKT
ncbi:inorganic triphosphatase, partial [Pseudoalteromonas sp. S186]